MKRVFIALSALILFAPLATAQTEAVQKEVDERLKSLQADDAELKRILANHPDILVAKVKAQLANAQLQQTEREVTNKYAELKTMIKMQKIKAEHFERIIQLNKAARAAVSAAEYGATELKLIEIKAELAKLEVELQSMQGEKSKPVDATAFLNRSNSTSIDRIKLDVIFEIEPGSPVDKLKSVIDQQIEYTCNGKKTSIALKELGDKYGSNFIVRINDTLTESTITVNGKHSFSAWIELILDDCNSQSTQLNTGPDGPKYLLDAYVRDYGILIAHRSKRPEGAMTLREFTAMVRAEKAAKTEPKK